MCRTEGEDRRDEDLSSLAHLWECPIDGNLIGGALRVEERSTVTLTE